MIDLVDQNIRLHTMYSEVSKAFEAFQKENEFLQELNTRLSKQNAALLAECDRLRRLLQVPEKSQTTATPSDCPVVLGH